MKRTTILPVFNCWCLLIIICCSNYLGLSAAYLHQNEICGNIDMRDKSAVYKLQNCTVIEGYLKFSLVRYEDQLFPKLREITGFMLMYRVEGLRTLSQVFPNLVVIRGQELVHNYALVAYEMQFLEDIGLSNLRVIMNGAVRLEKNTNMCYINTIDWSEIIFNEHHKSNNLMSENKGHVECVNVCPSNCDKTFDKIGNKNISRCWNAKNCQKDIACRCKQGCVNGSNVCCNEACIGGCYGLGPDKCVACRYFYHNSRCQRDCPSTHYKLRGWRCVTREECISQPVPRTGLNHLTLVRNNSMTNECVPDCPSKYTAYPNNSCGLCADGCPKICQGGEIQSIREAAQFEGCTIITGSIVINLDGGYNISSEFEKSLGSIVEVENMIKIVRSYSLISLHFFKSLKIIHGKKDENRSSDDKIHQHSLIVKDNHNLEDLFLPEVSKNLKLDRNKTASFLFNRKLCPDKIETFLGHLNLSTTGRNGTRMLNENDVSTNGDSGTCNTTKLKLYVWSKDSDFVSLKWEKFKSPDSRTLLSYYIYYREVPEQWNLTEVEAIFQGKDACSQNHWQKLEQIPDKNNNDQLIIGLIRNLSPWTRYAVYVEPITASKRSARSNIVRVRTLPSNPSAPSNLAVKALRERELTVTWNKPDRPNGNVTHYKIYWKPVKLNTAEFDERNYCEEPLDKKKEKKAEEKKKKLDVPLISTQPGCCACPKSIKDIEECKKELHLRLKFENALKDLVYIKKKKTIFKYSNYSSLQDLEHRLINITLPKIYSNPDLGSKSAVVKEKKVIPKTPKNKDCNDTNSCNTTTTDVTNVDDMPKLAVVRKVTSLNLTNLEHFQKYSIKVLACQEDDLYCSEQSNITITHTKTLPSATADTIDSKTVSVFVNETGKVNLTWDAPLHPNGLIITFEIEYGLVGPKNVSPNRKCLPNKKYRQYNGYILDQHFTAGNYSIKIRAVSLAGPGKWTTFKHFQIVKPPGSPILGGDKLAAIIIGVLVAIIIIGVIVWIVAKSKFIKEQELTTVSFNPGYMQASDVYTADEWEIDRDKINLLEKVLGQGSFGMVYEGFATDIVLFQEKEPKSMKVAVKIVNENASVYDRMIFLKEASTMKAFKSYHVVQLIGVVSIGQPAFVIMELMGKGDLKNFLRSRRPDIEEPTREAPPRLKDILQMLGEIADGMSYLADKKFVHRDLAARNCMVTQTNTVKVGDFGMTRDIYETDYYRKGERGLLPVRWMAPESLSDGVFSSMSDVWSFGVVLWEMATLAAQPYQGLSHEEVLKYVLDGRLMEKPERCPDQLFNLMSWCWQYKQRNRPTFKELIETLLPDLNQDFKEVSYFFSDENNIQTGPEFYDVEEHSSGYQNININRYPDEDLDESIDDESNIDLTVPFIEHTPVSHSSLLDNHGVRLGRLEPCECITLDGRNCNAHDTGKQGPSYKNDRAVQGPSFKNDHAVREKSKIPVEITDPDNRDESKSSDESFSVQNGLLNGHIYRKRLPHTSSFQ